MTVTKGTYCRNMRRFQISINISKAIFPREIVINNYDIFNRKCNLYIYFTICFPLENRKDTCYLLQEYPWEEEVFHQPRKKKTSMKHFFPFSFLQPHPKTVWKPFVLDLGGLLANNCSSFSAELHYKFAPWNQTKSLASQCLLWTD